MDLNYDTLDSLLNAYPIDTLTYEDIKQGISTFQYEDIYDPRVCGRRRKIGARTWSRFKTPIGSILHDVWYIVAKKIIYQEYDGWLLDSLEEWETEHGSQIYLAGYSKAEKNEMARKKAIELTVSKMYDNQAWVDFIPFNFNYRKSALQNLVVVQIMPSCCKKVGFISAQAYQYNGSYFCPHCGRCTPAEILSEEIFDENSYLNSLK